eukprot:TRINITY_DN6474_c0_g1_i10.p2 TRINITY_DN6474_c0_g1~~TRINITY_DN6474_c0_g1_i10.p2  ORF type:complete len:176 (-),score=0.62 TRINITY_DN6474_c0_g1_i10:921-1448(-)
MPDEPVQKFSCNKSIILFSNMQDQPCSQSNLLQQDYKSQLLPTFSSISKYYPIDLAPTFSGIISSNNCFLLNVHGQLNKFFYRIAELRFFYRILRKKFESHHQRKVKISLMGGQVKTVQIIGWADTLAKKGKVLQPHQQFMHNSYFMIVFLKNYMPFEKMHEKVWIVCSQHNPGN